MAGEGTPLQSATAAPDGAHGIGVVSVGTGTGSTPASVGSSSVRASDAERNAVVAQLSKATGEGRITLEEFADAAGAAYAAVTLAELDALYRSFGLGETLPHLSALPPPPDRSTPSPPSSLDDGAVRTTTRVHPASAPAEASASDLTDTVIAIMSGNNRKGRWRVRPRTRVIAFWGAAHLDLRDAAIDSPVVEIEACAVMGGVTIIVPEGIPVEMTGCVIMGGRKCRIADVPPLSGAPVIRVRAGGLWGGVEVRSRPSRRSGGVGAAVAAVSAATAMATAVIEGASTGAETLSPNGAEAGASAAPSWDRGVERLPGADRRRDDRDQGRTRDRDADRNGNRRDRSGRRESRPGASPPATPTQSGDLLTVVCTDIVGSTRLSVSLGDQRWHAVLSAHNALVRELIARHGGTEIKTVGDGFLLTFTSARAALQFSMALQDAVSVERSSSSRAAPSTPTSPSPALADAALELRIGVHAGEVERDGRDVIGRNVIIACRLCDVAEPGEVLASAVVADLADSASDLAFGPVREHNLVGIDQPLLAKPAIRA